MAAFYDAVIIGGGPGGSTVATLLARAGRKVVVVEREKFPRFHVGESMLPFSLPIFDRLGVHDKIRAAGFMEKYGAFFWNEDNGTTRSVVFAEARDPRHPKAYQVKRAEFDDLLLKHSASCGAEVREETSVEDVLFEGGRAVGVRVRGAGAGPEEIRAKVVVDASGQGAVLSRKLDLRRFDPKLKRAALFAHYEGIVWPEGSRKGDILLPIDNGIWYWIIPFSDGTCSVGGVFDPAAVRFAEGASVEGRYDEMLGRSPRMQELLAGARRVSGIHGVSDYSVDLRKARRRRMGPGRRRGGLPRPRVLDRRLPGARDGRARRADDRPRPRAARPRGRPGLREIRARVRAACGPDSGASCTASTIRSSSRPSARPSRPSASAPPSSRRWPAASSACRPRCGSGRS